MGIDKIKRIFEYFTCSGTFISATPYGSGQINETYLVKVDEEAAYILQRINQTIFTDVPLLMRNKELVCGHIRNKLIKQKVNDITRKYITYFYTNKGNPYYKDHDGNYWTLSLFIKGSKNYDTIPSLQLAHQFGVGLGEFENRVSDFDARLLTETLPLHHNVLQWQKKLTEAIENTQDITRVNKIESLVSTLSAFAPKMTEFQNMKDNGYFPLRVTHNDIQPNNLLFDYNDRPLCMIDLDTTMPGIIHYDIGDAFRSSCSTANSDESDLTKVHFNINYFEAVIAGFMEKAKNLLTRQEKRTLGFSCSLMTYLQAIRFLTDYLTGNYFYPIVDPEQNLRRANVQIQLLKEITKQNNAIETIIQNYQ